MIHETISGTTAALPRSKFLWEFEFKCSQRSKYELVKASGILSKKIQNSVKLDWILDIGEYLIKLDCIET